MTSSDYADALMWGAGFVTHHAKPWPDEPNPHPADIINCSHGVPFEELTSLMDDTLRFLTDNGRNGLGTVLVYSAGNRSELITKYLTWAAHPRTLAVTNTNRPKSGRELINGQCAFGPEIDLCAQGEGAWSLTLKAEASIRMFGGTSAAAAMVSAAAALMLSVNPKLRWCDVRDILRTTAKKRADGIGRKKDWKGGFSKRYGFGRLDVEAAVRAAHVFPS
jgi:subtilisin family serine protease